MAITATTASTYLRDKCPCATCTGAHGTPPRAAGSADNPFQMYKPALKMLGVEPVGQLRHPDQLERRPQLRNLLLRSFPRDLPVRGMRAPNKKGDPVARIAFSRFNEEFYSSRKLTSIVAATVTGLPSL